MTSSAGGLPDFVALLAGGLSAHVLVARVASIPPAAPTPAAAPATTPAAAPHEPFSCEVPLAEARRHLENRCEDLRVHYGAEPTRPFAEDLDARYGPAAVDALLQDVLARCPSLWSTAVWDCADAPCLIATSFAEREAERDCGFTLHASSTRIFLPAGAPPLTVRALEPDGVVTPASDWAWRGDVLTELGVSLGP